LFCFCIDAPCSGVIIFRVTQIDKEWILLEENKTLTAYARLLHQWTYAILVTIEGHESGYQFPLTLGDLERAANLKSGLQGDANVVLFDVFHDFIKPLLYPKQAGLRPEGDYSKWDDPLECMYAIAALRHDGTFQPAENVTGTFAMIKYHWRGAALYQAFRVNKQSGLNLEM